MAFKNKKSNKINQRNSENNRSNFPQDESLIIGSNTLVKRKRKKSSLKKMIIMLILIIVLALAAMGFVIFQYLFNGLNRTEITHDFSNLGIDSSRYEQTKDLKVINIALYGIDSRTNSNKGLSDAIMVASIDIAKGEIKITSIARDTYVDFSIPKGSAIKTKITEAYSYGGPELAIKTLNQNFNLDIQDYVTVNFNQLSKVIDSVGGVNITLTEPERVMANSIMNEVTPKSKKISKSGEVLLTGDQAVGYCRIRYIGTDDARTQRQRNVLQVLFNKAKNMNPVELANLIHNTVPMVETSLSNEKLISMAKIFTNKNVQMKEMAFPNSQSNEAHGEAAFVGTTWFYIYDLDVAKKQLYDFIYNDIKID